MQEANRNGENQVVTFDHERSGILQRQIDEQTAPTMDRSSTVIIIYRCPRNLRPKSHPVTGVPFHRTEQEACCCKNPHWSRRHDRNIFSADPGIDVQGSRCFSRCGRPVTQESEQPSFKFHPRIRKLLQQVLSRERKRASSCSPAMSSSSSSSIHHYLPPNDASVFVSPRVVARLRLTTSREAPATGREWDFFPPASPVFAPRRKRLLPATPSPDIFPRPGSLLPPHRRSRTPGPTKPKQTVTVSRSRSLTAPKSSVESFMEGEAKCMAAADSASRSPRQKTTSALRQLHPSVRKSRILPPDPPSKPARLLKPAPSASNSSSKAAPSASNSSFKAAPSASNSTSKAASSASNISSKSAPSASNSSFKAAPTASNISSKAAPSASNSSSKAAPSASNSSSKAAPSTKSVVTVPRTDSSATSRIPRPRRNLPVVNSNGPVIVSKSAMFSEETTRMERLPTKIPVPNSNGEAPKSTTTSARLPSAAGQGPDTGKRREDSKNTAVTADTKEEDEGGRKRRGEGTSGQTTVSTRVTKTAATAQHPHLFYIGGSNGVQLVESALLAMGWKRTMDKNAENFKLKWTETKGQVNFNSFKEGDQLVNHIPNCDLITNKLGLLLSLREYERVTWAVKNRPPKLQMSEFVPETYILDDRREREAFFEAHKEGDIWICKPTGWNQGKGIYLVRDMEQYKQELSSREAKLNDKNNLRRPMGRIVQKKPANMILQRYLKNPLLLEGRKFDIRAYMVICSTMPFLVLYHPGYVRLCMHKYSNNSTDMTIHLTNQFIQKKDPGYEEVKNDTVWSMEKLYEYILETYGEEKKLNENTAKIIDRQIQRIMLHVFNSVRHKLAARIGFFEIYGFDFMIDTDMNVWLIEVNINPALHVNCDLLREILPPIIEQTLHVSIECFEKAKRHQPLLPLASMKTFQVLFSTSNAIRNVRGSPQGNIKYNVTSRYRSQSQSPARDSQQQSMQPPYGPNHNPATSEQEPAARRFRQPPALAYSTRALSYDANAKQAPLPPPVVSQSLEDSRAKPFEDSLRRYKRIDNRRVSRPSGTTPAPAPTQWNRTADQPHGDDVEEGDAGQSNYDSLTNANSALAAALTRVAHDRTMENRRQAGSSGELPTLGSLRMRTPRQTPRETVTTRFMPAPMTTVRVISTTGSPTPGELGVGQLPLSHPLNQHRLKPTLHALSNPPHRRARTPPDRSS